MSNSFAYDGLDARVGKVDSAGTATYRRDGADVTDDVLSDGAAVYTPGISQRRAGATTFELPDRLGTSIRQTNATTNTQATRAYDAFGVLTASTGTPQGPFGFAGTEGYQEDGDSGLKLLGHRYYDPSTARFLTRDPAQDGRNWYAYCDDNPLKGVDPEGYRPGPTKREKEYLRARERWRRKHPHEVYPPDESPRRTRGYGRYFGMDLPRTKEWEPAEPRHPRPPNGHDRPPFDSGSSVGRGGGGRW